MERDPKDPAMKEILTKNLKKLIAIIVFVTGGFLVALYFTLLRMGFALEEIQTIMFIALSVDSIFFTFSIKNLHKPIWQVNPFSNKYLVFAFLASLTALFLALTFPPIRNLLSLMPISGVLYLVLGFGLVNLFIIELGKRVVFRTT
jgi:magnesium-transporting ATPase (P-type)